MVYQKSEKPLYFLSPTTKAVGRLHFLPTTKAVGSDFSEFRTNGFSRWSTDNY